MTSPHFSPELQAHRTNCLLDKHFHVSAPRAYRSNMSSISSLSTITSILALSPCGVRKWLHYPPCYSSQKFGNHAYLSPLPIPHINLQVHSFYLDLDIYFLNLFISFTLPLSEFRTPSSTAWPVPSPYFCSSAPPLLN